MILAAAMVAGCCPCGNEPVAKSPDGRNEIRLTAKPLAVEVLRDGVSVARTAIGLKVDGADAFADREWRGVRAETLSGEVASPVYKKASVKLAANKKSFDFGDGFSVELIARDDGVAYRFVTAKPGEITVNGETVELALDPEATCWSYRSFASGWEESEGVTGPAKALTTGGKYNKQIYLPLSWKTGGKCVAFTESDVCDYPILNFTRGEAEAAAAPAVFHAALDRFPTKVIEVNWGDKDQGPRRLRKRPVTERADYLVKTAGTRAFPWRTFLLADTPAAFPVADIVWALSRGQAAGDFSWVKPGKVAWDWWNAFDNKGEEKGCTTAGYKRFVDFAAKTGVEYVIMDEGWSETLNIWKFSPRVDVAEVIRYANSKGVGIILWMAWAQIQGEEAKVAQHFAKLGAKGFKVDFMDRGDADVERFLWKFADECAKAKMLVDYHGAHRPTGMSRVYPNVLNYEGVRGLENMKWYDGAGDFMDNDLRCFFFRLAAGPMDYTPGAMDNYPVDAFKGGKKPTGYDGEKDVVYGSVNPGSCGTRCRQMAMMTLYEAPLQMLADSPTKYEKNFECFKFMAATPVVWADSIALECDPATHAAIARQAKDGSWYAAAMSNREARDYTLDTAFLGGGEWQAEIFRDAPESDEQPKAYVHETKSVKSGEKMIFRMAKGGGFSVRFAK